MHGLTPTLALVLANLNAFASAQDASNVVTVTVSTCYSGSTIPYSLVANSTALDSSASILSQSSTALATGLSLSSGQSTSTTVPVSTSTVPSSTSSSPFGYPSDTLLPEAPSSSSTSVTSSATSTPAATDSSAAPFSLTAATTSSTDAPIYSTPTSTDISTSTPTNPAAPVLFAIQASGGPNDGQWAYIDQSAFEIVFTADQTQAVEFALYSNGTLSTPVDGKFANQDNGASYEPFYFSSADDVAAQGYQLFACTLGAAVSDTTTALSCVVNGANNVVQSDPTDPDVPYVGSDLGDGEQFELVAVSGVTFAQS